MKRIARRILIIVLLLPGVVYALRAVMTSFERGELSPRLFGRTETIEFYRGCRVLENMFVKPQGPVEKRPGTYYVADAAGESRAIAFVVSTDKAFILELSAGSMRFFIDE